MKRLIFSTLLVCFSSVGMAKSFQCVDPEDGFKAVTTFDSVSPLLQMKLYTLNPDGTVASEHTKIEISKSNACNVKLNFGSDCSTKENESALGYSFSFECSSKKISGEFYVGTDGTATLTCNNSQHSMYFNCATR